jgi:predicted Ser/Thr protein kinase
MDLAGDVMILADGPLVIPADLMLVQARDLPPAEREALGAEYDEAGAVLGRRTSRSSAVVVNGRLLDLYEEFRDATPVAVAIARYATRTGQPAERVLDDSFQSLMRLRAIGFLITQDEAKAAGPVYVPGDTVAGWRVRQCLQSYQDSDVYTVDDGGFDGDGRWAVCKTARLPRDTSFRRSLRREAAALRLLGSSGVPVPAVITLTADEQERPLLIMSHVEGRRIDHCAADLRRVSMPRLVRACARMIETLALMHRRGVLHGDVHGGNYLLTPDDGIVAVDFPHACMTTRPRGRRGVPRLMDPQWARARLAGLAQPPNSPEAEQYSMAALVYFLLAGEHHYDTHGTEEQLQAALAQGRPNERFYRLLGASLSDIVDVLQRALDPDPGRRWPELVEFSAAFGAAAETFVDASVHDCAAARPHHRFGEYLSAALLAQSPPATSLASGSAGTALALLAVSAARDDPVLLAWADLWSEESAARSEPARLDRPEQAEGRGGSWHGRLGVHGARVAISHALDDRVTRETAITAYLREHACYLGESVPLDLTHGLASCLLMDAHLTVLTGGNESLRRAGAQAADVLSERMEHAPQRPGLAHGSGGHLLALLAWHGVAPDSAPPVTAIGEHLGQMAEAVRSPATVSLGDWCRPEWEATWCNGASGLVLLFLAAADALRESRHLDHAETAMRIALSTEPHGHDLCCGTAGRIYALGRLGHATGEGSWTRRAERELRLLEDGLSALPPHGLVKGRAGALAMVDGFGGQRFPSLLIDPPTRCSG